MLCAALVVVTLAGCGGEGHAQPPPSSLERKAARIEARLAHRPDDARLLRATMQAWIAAGSHRIYTANLKGRPVRGRASADFRMGLRFWQRYLRQTGGDAGYELAELVGGTYFALLEIGSRDVREIEQNAAEAARALRIAGRHRHNLFTLSNVAVYAYFNGENAVGDRAARGAVADVPKARRWIVFEQLDTSRERGEVFQAHLERAARQLRESGDAELEQPLRAFASYAGINRRE